MSARSDATLHVPRLADDAADLAWDARSLGHLVATLRERHPDVPPGEVVLAARRALIMDPLEVDVSRLATELREARSRIAYLERELDGLRGAALSAWLGLEDERESAPATEAEAEG